MKRIVIASLVFLLSGCVAERGEVPITLPIGEGAQEFSDWWQGKTPTTSSSPPVGATGLAKSQSTPSPSPTGTEPTPAETQSAEVPQAVPPPPLETIEGVQEVHYASFPSQCYQMDAKFKAQGLRLRLVRPITLVNFPGRSGRPRRGTKRLSSKRGSYYACIFQGPDAVANRYGVNDDYMDAGLDVPDHDVTRHPNDYRNPDPVESPDPTNPNRRTVPDPDPNRPQTPSPYDDLPY